MPITAARANDNVLRSLQAVCDSQGLPDLAARLADLADLVKSDMRDVNVAIDALPNDGSVVQQGAHHLLDMGGKRLRPICVSLASRLGSGFSDEAKQLSVAVELVHCATLLHDDVIDVADERRGAPSARTVYGNAASIFAGDWLLIDALRRVRETGLHDSLARLLDIIDEMIEAEAVQLANRGVNSPNMASYFHVVEGKTAALFRWAMYAGARAGGLDVSVASKLEAFGTHLGFAFQLVDDWLDYAGDEAETGKARFTDLREGKFTYPLLIAIERDASTSDIVQEVLRTEPGAPAATASMRALLTKLDQTDALAATRALAEERGALACTCLDAFPDSRAKSALLTVAQATAQRRS